MEHANNRSHIQHLLIKITAYWGQEETYTVPSFLCNNYNDFCGFLFVNSFHTIWSIMIRILLYVINSIHARIYSSRVVLYFHFLLALIYDLWSHNLQVLNFLPKYNLAEWFHIMRKKFHKNFNSLGWIKMVPAGGWKSAHAKIYSALSENTYFLL